jgi:hypothetical protein
MTILFLRGAGDFYLLRALETGSGEHPASYLIDICGKVARE